MADKHLRTTINMKTRTQLILLLFSLTFNAVIGQSSFYD